MSQRPDAAEWLKAFPNLEFGEDDLLGRIRDSSRVLSFDSGELIFSAGQLGGFYPLVLNGTLRVALSSDEGREILLYRLEPGTTCMLSTACLFSGDRVGVLVSAESAVRVAALPAQMFHDLLDSSPHFRAFVFRSLSVRLGELLGRIDGLVFQPIEQRLALSLLRLQTDGRLATTHAELALELGTAREVVSRHLKQLEQRGLLRLGRGQIELLDQDQLRLSTFH